MNEQGKICPRCGYDHDRPGSTTAAARVLACIMPEHGFVTKHETVQVGKDSAYVTGEP